MNDDLYTQFLKMDLKPGCSILEVNERFKALAFLLHPDQMVGDKRKEAAEREMKMVNNRRDFILRHLKGADHRLEGQCECRAPRYTRNGEEQKAGGFRKNGADAENSSPQQESRSPQPKPQQQPRQQPRQQPQQQQKQPQQQSPWQQQQQQQQQQHRGQRQQHEQSQSKSERSKATEPPKSAPRHPTGDSLSSKPTQDRFKTNSDRAPNGTTSGASRETTNKSEEHSNLANFSKFQTVQNCMAAIWLFGFALAITGFSEALDRQRNRAIGDKIQPTHFVCTTSPIVRTFTSRTFEPMPAIFHSQENPKPPQSYIVSNDELSTFTSTQLLESMVTLTNEFRQLLSQIQSPENFSQNELAGRIPTLYKRFNFVDNQKKIFENELRRRGIPWKNA